MAREVDDSENDPATVDLQSDDTCPLSKSSRNATFLRTGVSLKILNFALIRSQSHYQFYTKGLFIPALKLAPREK